MKQGVHWIEDGGPAGPVVWTGIIATTCLLLVALEHMLWLAIPFIFGTVLYYILLAPMRRLIRLGVGQDLAALTVGGGFFAVLSLALAAAFSWSASPEDSAAGRGFARCAGNGRWRRISIPFCGRG